MDYESHIDREISKSIKLIDQIVDDPESSDVDTNGNAYGTIFRAKIDETPVVIKMTDIHSHTLTEIAALTLLNSITDKNIRKYFIKLRGHFATTVGERPVALIAMEPALNLYELMCSRNLTALQYRRIFRQIATAVEFLESIEMNHGDLWVENIMYVGDIDDPDNFCIKIIDFDSAFRQNDPYINCPAIGGSTKPRNKFIRGYDLNRYFKSLKDAHTEYQELKNEARSAWNAQKNTRGSFDDTIGKEFDDINVVYPDEIVEFLESLQLNSLDSHTPNVSLSGSVIRQAIMS